VPPLDIDYDMTSVELQTFERARGKAGMSLLARLHEEQNKIAARNGDPWLLRLERVQGQVDYDGIARVSTQTLLDILEVPQNRRTAGTYRLLKKTMAALGWTAVRVRDMTRGGYKEQVRGYCRDARNGHRSTVSDRDRTPAARALV
jgi:hypothetical protein